jgi:hypothetical protein
MSSVYLLTRTSLSSTRQWYQTRSYSGSWQCSTGGRTAAPPYSALHRIRTKDLPARQEDALIELYFESQEDSFMKEKIAMHCATKPELTHITEHYLERMAKIKLFL